MDQVGGEQTDGNFFQCTFGFGNIDDIVKGTIYIQQFCSIQIGAVGYTSIETAIYRIVEGKELGKIDYLCGNYETSPQQPITDAVKELG